MFDITIPAGCVNFNKKNYHLSIGCTNVSQPVVCEKCICGIRRKSPFIKKIEWSMDSY